MDREFADLLKQIGFTDGLHVPVANEENSKLQNEVEVKLRRKAELMIKLKVQNEQLSRIKTQIKNLKSQKEQNQELTVAHHNQLEAERGMLHESDFGLKKTRQETQHMQKKIKESQNNQRLLQEEIKRSMKKLEQLKKEVEWGEDARRAWQEELAASERQNNVLEHFRFEDDTKFKEMELKRQRLKADVMEREAILTNELNNMAALENQLEQVSSLFRRAHKERMSLISFWENAVRILNQRDNHIETALQEIGELKELAREKHVMLEEEQKFYETQCANNEEVSTRMNEVGASTTQQRSLNLEQAERSANLRSEVSTLRGVLQELGSALSKERSCNSHLGSEVQAREARLQALHTPLVDSKTRLAQLDDTQLTSAQRTKEIDNILKVTEKNNNLMQNKIDKLQEKVFERTSELEYLKDTSKLMSNELKIFEINKQAYEKKAAEIEKGIILKEQMLYDLDMGLVTLDSKLARLQGQRTDEEKLAVKLRITEFEETLRKKSDVLTLVTAQYDKAKKEQVHLSDEVDAEMEELRRLTEHRQELMFLVDGGQKQLSTLQASNRQQQVALNLLRLRVDQREKALSQCDSKVYTLEREKHELDNAIRERKIEIGLQMDLMMSKKRTLEEEKAELKKALERLNIRVSQLQKKHDIVMDTLGKEETGEDFSVAHFKIKIAQERYELQETGDELDSKIKTMESEIPAMENTLRVISAANDCYKKNLDSIDSSSPEMQEKKLLEEKLDQTKNKLKERQSEIKEISSKIHELEMSLGELGDEEERVQLEWRDRDVAARTLDKELEEQQNKLARADKLLRKLKREARQVKEPRVPLHLAEKDIELRELQDINQSALQQLAELSIRYSEVAPALNRYLGEKGMSLPLVMSRSKRSCGSNLSTQRSLLSEESHTSLGCGAASLVASVVNLDLGDVQPASSKASGDSKHTQTSGSGKKSK